MMGDQLKTDEDGVAFVKSIFRILERRPGHRDMYELMTTERDNFLMDFENACLSQNWDNSKKPFPKGMMRHTDAEWGEMIKTQVYPHHSDVDWEEYCDWIFFGGGDECFQEDDDSEVNGQHTASANLR